MKVNLHAVNFNVDKKLVDFVQEKIDKLEKYYDKIVSADVFLKLEKIGKDIDLSGERVRQKRNSIFEKLNSKLQFFQIFEKSFCK